MNFHKTATKQTRDNCSFYCKSKDLIKENISHKSLSQNNTNLLFQEWNNHKSNLRTVINCLLLLNLHMWFGPPQQQTERSLQEMCFYHNYFPIFESINYKTRWNVLGRDVMMNWFANSKQQHRFEISGKSFQIKSN